MTWNKCEEGGKETQNKIPKKNKSNSFQNLPLSVHIQVHAHIAWIYGKHIKGNKMFYTSAYWNGERINV